MRGGACVSNLAALVPFCHTPLVALKLVPATGWAPGRLGAEVVCELVDGQKKGVRGLKVPIDGISPLGHKGSFEWSKTLVTGRKGSQIEWSR